MSKYFTKAGDMTKGPQVNTTAADNRDAYHSSFRFIIAI